ncbi:MAG: hypothetical protein IMX00_09735 [Limnochordales bacterium]|nr:hypothetical protein [Limnochordales bacterium]
MLLACHRSRMLTIVALVVTAAGLSIVRIPAQAESDRYILLQAESFDGVGTDPTKGWAISQQPGDKGLYGNFKVAVVAAWMVKNAVISTIVDVPHGGDYAVWVRHFNLKSDKENYNLNFLLAIIQDGEVLVEHRFAVESKGGWDVWLWDRADQTVPLKEGKVTVVIIASDGAQGNRGVDAVLLTPDLSLDPNKEDIPL